MGSLQVLVESVSFGNKFLLPLSESLFLDLDLLGESFSQVLFLFLELGIVELPWPGFSELSGLHLKCSVGFVVLFFGGVDKIKHVCADEDGAELLEITVVFILNLCDTPGVLAALDDVAIAGLDVLLGADDGKWHDSHQAAGVLGSLFIVLLNRGLVDLDSLGFNDSADLLHRTVSSRKFF